MLSIGEAAVVLGVHVSTLRRWDKDGTCSPSQRTKGGHRRYTMNDLLGSSSESIQPRHAVAYARVSSHDQASDLTRQVERLEQHCLGEGYLFQVITDLGSGINFKKKACVPCCVRSSPVRWNA